MQLHVGPATYTVTRRFNLTLDGEAVKGFIDFDTLTICVDGMVEGSEEIEAVLRHEHAHAWEWHVGKPEEPEAIAQWAATVGQTFDRDYAAGGKARGFRALPIGGTRPSGTIRRVPETPFAASQYRACGNCGQSLTPGSIAADEPLALGAERYVVDRWMKCPYCDVVTCWRETCDESGTPAGGIIKARLLSGQDAAAWLAKHPTPQCEWNVA